MLENYFKVIKLVGEAIGNRNPLFAGQTDGCSMLSTRFANISNKLFYFSSYLVVVETRFVSIDAIPENSLGEKRNIPNEAF